MRGIFPLVHVIDRDGVREVPVTDVSRVLEEIGDRLKRRVTP